MLKIFVYGTLMTGYANYHWFLRPYEKYLRRVEIGEVSGAGLVAQRRSAFPYAVFHRSIDLKKYPLLNTNPVRGELLTYSVSPRMERKMLAMLDHLEGVDREHYLRRKVDVIAGDTIEQAWMYAATEESAEWALRAIGWAPINDWRELKQ